jgi:DNA-binding PadR family transcriptional regulator
MRRKKGQLVELERQIIEFAKTKEGFYGYELIKELDIKYNGTLYRALRRLEIFGYLSSEWDSQANTNTPRRRIYTLLKEKYD